MVHSVWLDTLTNAGYVSPDELPLGRAVAHPVTTGELLGLILIGLFALAVFVYALVKAAEGKRE